MARLPVACWSLELAEKTNNYLNIRWMAKSSEPPGQLLSVLAPFFPASAAKRWIV
jgi:hypothetical protein